MRRAGSISGNLRPHHTKNKKGAAGKAISNVRLDFSSLPIYGRETERKLLIELYCQAALGKSESVLVKGVSGAGKTALVHAALIKAVEATGGFFCEGKFQEDHRLAPYTAIVNALTQLLQKHIALLDESEIHEALGDGAQLLFQLIPPLRGICARAAAAAATLESSSPTGLTNGMTKAGNSDDTTKHARPKRQVSRDPPNLPNDAYALDRFLHLFASLVKAVVSRKHPLVMFLDDLQWADASSLQLLSHLMDDAEMKYVFFIGAYRHELEHKLESKFLDLLQSPVKSMLLQDLEFDDVNALIASAVGAPPGAVEPLTGVIYRKTGGNCFYVKQFLGMLQDEEYLYYLPHAACWEYDLDGILGETNVAENVAELVVERLEHLRPEECQLALKLASCLGFTFDTRLLMLVIQEEHPELDIDETKMVVCCQTLMKAGLVERSGSNMQLKFAHDRIQSCAYSMIVRKKLLHLRIGFLLQRLYEQDPYFQQEWVFFSLVDQLNLGSDGIRESSERKFLVQLNLEAGKEAKRRSAFLAAAEYVEFALQLLQGETRGEDINDHWKEEYDLTLELTNFAAEMYLCAGRLAQSRSLAELVLENAKVIDDKSRMFITMIQLSGAKGDMKGGSAIGINFLKDLGYQLPKRPNALHVLFEMHTTKRVLRHLSDDDILGLPVATDTRIITSIKLLTMVTSYLILSHQAKSAYSQLCTCLVVQLSIKNGLSSESAAGFALFSAMLAMTNNPAAAQRYVNVSLRMLALYSEPSTHALANACVFSVIRHWRYLLQESVNAFHKGHKLGVQSEIPEFGCLNAVMYSQASFICGKPLLKLSSDLKRFALEASELKQSSYALILNTQRQLVLNLLGYAKDPLQLNGAALQEQDAETEAKDEPDEMERRMLAWSRLELASLLNNYPMMKALLPEIGSMRSANAKGHFAYVRESFLAGLAYIRLSKFNSRYRRSAKQHLARFEKWTKNGCPNCSHLYLLLKAQLGAVHSRTSYNTTEFFDEAIFAAWKVGFKNDEALANELAGEYCKSHNDAHKAARYMLRAYQLYRMWGADIKLDQLKIMHDDIGLSEMVAAEVAGIGITPSSSMRSIRGRKKVSFAGQKQPPEANAMRQIESMDNLVEFEEDRSSNWVDDKQEQRRNSS
jgi:predicted ATPase